MPTFNRRRFAAQAVHYFLAQDYAEKELVIVDDGTELVTDLVPQDPRVRYFRQGKKQPLGAKRNFACEQARGRIIMHCDDDDWSAP
jgi:glycosyltransferase involved in cell wall biosynthesis